jgi:hypothetical protein
MRTVTTIVSAMTLTLLAAAVPVLSAENRLMDEMLLPKKDTCLLLAKNCHDNAYVLEQRIKLLQDEINKGNLAYTDDELNILKKKLNDANRALEFLFDEGA